MCKARDLPGPRGATRSSGRSPCWSPRGSSGPEPRPLNGHLPGVPGTLLTLTPTQASPVHAAQKAAPHAVAGERRPEEKPASARRAFDTWFVLSGGSHSGLPPWGGGRKGEKQKTCAHTCTLTCVHTHAHSHTCTHSHTHSHTHTHPDTHANTSECTHRHMHTQTHMDTHLHRHRHTQTGAHTHTRTQTPSLTHTDTRTHTKTPSLTCPGRRRTQGMCQHGQECAPAAWPCAAPRRAGACRRASRPLLDGCLRRCTAGMLG